MRGVALWFMASALIYLAAGMVLGIVMAASHDHTFAPVHGHLNLVGWVTFALFAIIYHVVPEAARGPLPLLHFAASTLAVWLMVPGIALVQLGETEALAATGAFTAILSLALFAAILWRARSPAERLA